MTAQWVGSPEHVRLWEAIGEVVAASGGRTADTSVHRQKAVVRVERALEAIAREAERRGMERAAGVCEDRAALWRGAAGPDDWREFASESLKCRDAIRSLITDDTEEER